MVFLIKPLLVFLDNFHPFCIGYHSVYEFWITKRHSWASNARPFNKRFAWQSCWMAGQYNFSPLGNETYFQAKKCSLFLPSCKPSIAKRSASSYCFCYFSYRASETTLLCSLVFFWGRPCPSLVVASVTEFSTALPAKALSSDLMSRFIKA